MASKSIASFFKPAAGGAAQKKKAAADEPEPAAKLSKITEASTDAGEAAEAGAEGKSAPLTPEQQQRIETQKLAAAMKLAQTKGVPLPSTMGASWRSALQAEFSKDYFKELTKFLEEQAKAGKAVYPPPQDVFSFSRACEIDEVRVVILGQDPYHGPGQAHGLSFSVLPGVKAPPSLVNMYKELETDIPGFMIPNHGYLMSWAKQGVLCLNAVLTVERGSPNSHANKGWEKFTDAIISWINKNRHNVVFILWGSYAQKKGKDINKEKHCVIVGPHPSPLSAHKGFFGCKHFSKTNDYLTKKGQLPIDWNSLNTDDNAHPGK